MIHAPLLALTLSGAVWAARPPDPERSERLVASLMEASRAGEVAPEQVDDWLRPAAGWSRDRQQVWEEAMSRRLSTGGELHRALSGRAIAGAVEGPDYTRVVVEGSPWLTFVVRRSGEGPRIEGVLPSDCGLCEEPERFVVDLLRDIRRGEDRERLLMGVELYVSEDALGDGVDPVEWGRSLDRRNVHTGYLRWLLRDAAVVSAWGEGVTVRVGDREETWSVVWQDDRWMLDYASLPEDSPLRLKREDVVRWKHANLVAQGVADWWLPEMTPVGDATLIARSVMYAAPRRGSGELVIYNQDLGRTAAILIRLDPETGEVLDGHSLPLLSSKLQVAPFDWRSLFKLALSPDGNQLAIAVHTNLRVIDVESGGTVYETLESSAAGALAWDPQQSWLAACDAVGSTMLLRASDGWVESRAQVGDGCIDLVWRQGSVTAVTDKGGVKVLSVPSLKVQSEDEGICCGAPSGAEAMPGTGGLAVSCTASCAPIWLWEMPATWETDGEALLLSDDRISALAGQLSVDPTGRWMVAPWDGAGGRAVLVDIATGAPLRVFAHAPLVQISWDLDADALYAVDREGRLWRWSLSRLRAGPPP